ncbi:hypothetical protein [Demequina mangrovi]|uniref:DUF4190 domain-containing protein n=1 Tax=Demequina mangrovi TaxID=1043493 RepID=A0A1H7A582_9MICO|nr:hypothetical protein [Demequina mangrovi]SEJ59594.1 hypothetical protein SAMN05421637_2358 [Demequina mangrovi]
MTGGETFLPEPEDPRSAGPGGDAWPTPATREPTDVERWAGTVPRAEAPAWGAAHQRSESAHWGAGAASGELLGGSADERYLPYAGVTAAQNDVRGRTLSNEGNRYGHYAVAVGGAAALATSLMFLVGGVLWLYVGMGAAAVYSGVRGWNAAARGLATNPRTAATGIALGLATLLGSLGYVAWTVLQVAEAVEEAM